jgi:hypothetical protein
LNRSKRQKQAMPVIIRDINWEETDTNLVLHIPMKGAKANKLDVLSSDQYLKVRRYMSSFFFF